ncbi:MAG: trimethylamine methyltransferase family protein [Anaerolineae bacterium]
MLKRLIRELKPYRWQLAAAILLTALNAGVPLLPPQFQRRIIDDALQRKDLHYIILLIAGLIGGNMIHDVGYIESGLTSSPDMLVASDEIIGMVKRFLQGIPVTRETVPLETIDQVGPGGHYLGTDHTLRHFKTEFWKPMLMDRLDWDRWVKAGSKPMRERVHQRVLEILQAEREPLFDEKMYKELRRICELADERHKGEEMGIGIV